MDQLINQPAWYMSMVINNHRSNLLLLKSLCVLSCIADGVIAPGQPTILPEDCSAENNSVTIAWQPYPGSVVDAYTLELNDGNGGDFRVEYIGPEMMCTVDGLHFNRIYNARVKGQSHADESEYSDLVSLQTAEVAWFSLDPTAAHPDIIISNDNLTATCNSFEHRIILGGVGFSRPIDRYDINTDAAIGIARFDVSKADMLGKDDKVWCMYVDSKRSWFMHSDIHTDRTEGGINRGSIIGVLLDLDPAHSATLSIENHRDQWHSQTSVE